MLPVSRFVRSVLATSLAAGSLAVLSIASAPAALAVGEQPVPGHTALVPDKPRANTPRISDGEIWDMATIGTRVYIAGGFTSLTNTTGNLATVNQSFLAAYNINTGLIDTGFRPVFTGGSVSTVEASPDGKLYIGGTFNTINGVTKRKLAQISPTTGGAVAAFTADGNAEVNAIAASNSTVYAGGRFTTLNGTPMVGLAAVNRTTGALDAGFNNQLSGGIGVGGAITVQVLKLTHDNTKLVVVHTARKIAGQDRYGIGMINTATKQLTSWRTRLWEDNLQYVGGIQRVFGGDVAPNDQYLVVSSGSGGDRPPINDTAVAFPIAGADNVQPLWVNRMFDSVYSVGISEKAVYVGGHISFSESNTASDPWPGLTTQGYGFGQGIGAYALGDEVVRRDHIAALDPATGHALEWNPGSNSFEGNKSMLVTPRGLFAGGDAMIQGGVKTGRVAFYDLNSAVAPTATDTTITAPIEGRIVPAGTQFTVTGTAKAATGIKRVQVELVNAAGQYLQDDKVSWGAANNIYATLGTTTAGVTQWSLPLTISDAQSIKVQAKAYGLNGTNDATKAIKKMESFVYGNTAPVARITAPARGLVTSLSFVMSGTATDDQGVQSISILLRDENDNYLDENGVLHPEYYTYRISPDVVGATSTTWQTEVTLPHTGVWRAGVLATDTTGLNGATFFPGANFTVDTTGAPPSVSIGAPLAVIPPTVAPTLNVQPGSPMTFSGTATDDIGLAKVEISLRNTSTRENLAADGSWGTGVQAGNFRVSPLNLSGKTYNWTYTTPFNLSPGTYSFSVRATDNQELSTPTANQGRLTINAQPTGDLPPNGLITSTAFDQSLEALTFPITGTATDDKAVTAVKVSLLDGDTGRYLKSDGTMGAGFATVDAAVSNPGTASTNWSLNVTVPQAGTWQATAFAVDSLGQWDPSTTGATSRYLVYPGDADPTLEEALRTPITGNAFADARIPISGRAADDVSIYRVEVAVVNSAGNYMATNGVFSAGERWIQAFVNSPGSLGSNYSYTTPAIPSGTYTVKVRPVDGHLQYPVSTDSVVTVTSPPGNAAPVPSIIKTCTSNSCVFDARGTTDENAATVVYSWNFGNGRTGTGPLPTNIFFSPGTFPVSVTATDEYGAVGTASTSVTIATPPGNVAPTAVFPQPSCVSLVCAVSGAASTDANVGDAINYSFNWGDGTPVGTTSAGNHTYAAGGTYTITMTATDGWGAAAAPISRTVTVAP